MKRRFLSILLVLVLCLGLGSAVFASGDPATSGEFGEGLTWELSADGTLTVSGTGRMWLYISGASYSPSGEIPPWEDVKDRIKTVVIEPGLTGIGAKAFQGCENLTSVSIPGSVANIDEAAFRDCDSLTSVTIPGGVTFIYNHMFRGCTGLQSVTILEGVRAIDRSAFEGCTSLTSVTIPSSVIKIGISAFEDCASLTDVYYGGSENDWAKITILAINESLTEAQIHYGSDVDLSSGEPSAELPGEYIQSGSGGEDIRWTYDMKTGVLTFSGTGQMRDFLDWVNWGEYLLGRPWPNPKSVVIEPGIVNISVYTFKGYTSLTSVTIPLSVTEIGGSAFSGCANLTDVYYAGTESDWANIAISGDNAPLDTARMHYNWTPET